MHKIKEVIEVCDNQTIPNKTQVKYTSETGKGFDMIEGNINVKVGLKYETTMISNGFTTVKTYKVIKD